VWLGFLKRKAMKFTKSEVEFKVNGRQVKFVIIHNLPDTPGLSFDDALQNWVNRTTIFTAESLCEYSLSKNTEYVVMTEERFLKMTNQ
jgi:hypothetical protein